MTTLHMLMTASTEPLQSLLPQLRQDDAILLAGDACYLISKITGINVYVLGTDLEARGLSAEISAALSTDRTSGITEGHIRVLNDEAWPDLVLSYDQQVTWP